MPPSIFSSRPKSDRRQQWKALKAKHAKTISASTVEIGLGKALDAHQKQVDLILGLEKANLDAAAFTPVVTSAKAVKKLAIDLEQKPKVKSNTDYKTFLAGLKKDADWWDITAQNFKRSARDLSSDHNERAQDAMRAVQTLQTQLPKVDLLLKPAAKKSGKYTPHAYVLNLARSSATVRPQLAKLTVLLKNPTGNLQLIRDLLLDTSADLMSLRQDAAVVSGLDADDFPAGTNLRQVQTEAQKLADAAFQLNQAGTRIRV